jgi:hypothetical protein
MKDISATEVFVASSLFAGGTVAAQQCGHKLVIWYDKRRAQREAEARQREQDRLALSATNQPES